MDVAKLVRMVNQIGHFFRAEEDREAAIAGVEQHLRRFWEPRMRRAIVEHLERGGEGLEDIPRAAVERLARSGQDRSPVSGHASS